VKPVSLLVLLAALATAGCGADSASSEDIVARVNGTEITAAELEKQFQSRVTGAEQPPAPEEAEDLKLQLLSQMINDPILLEMASEAGRSATEAEVDVRFNEFKGQYTEEQFQEVLAQQKMTADDIKAELRKQLTVEKLVNKEITSKITVSEQEIQDFYEKNKEGFNLPEGHHVAHILVTPVPEPGQTNAQNDDAKTPEEARAKAQRLLREIQGGIDFAIVARDYSEDLESSQAGGDLSFQSIDALNGIDPVLGQAVQRLRVGETSPSFRRGMASIS
jgi:peptidyl-prolyl cis-trans isomerase SurA